MPNIYKNTEISNTYALIIYYTTGFSGIHKDFKSFVSFVNYKIHLYIAFEVILIFQVNLYLFIYLF